MKPALHINHALNILHIHLYVYIVFTVTVFADSLEGNFTRRGVEWQHRLKESIKGSHRSLWCLWHETDCRTCMDLEISRVKGQRGQGRDLLMSNQRWFGSDMSSNSRLLVIFVVLHRYECWCGTSNRLRPSPNDYVDSKPEATKSNANNQICNNVWKAAKHEQI